MRKSTITGLVGLAVGFGGGYVAAKKNVFAKIAYIFTGKRKEEALADRREVKALDIPEKDPIVYKTATEELNEKKEQILQDIYRGEVKSYTTFSEEQEKEDENSEAEDAVKSMANEEEDDPPKRRRVKGGDDIRQITQAEFQNQLQYYDKNSWEWYEGDNQVVDAEKEEVIDDAAECIGHNFRTHFFEGDEPDVIYIRNNTLRADFEIARDPRSWAEVKNGEGGEA